MKTALAKSLLALALALTGMTACAESLTEILRKHAEAMGGVDKIAAVKSAIIITSAVVGGMEGASTTYYKAPDKFRIDLQLPIMSYTQACDGDNCWLQDQQGLMHSLGSDLKGLVVTQMALDRATYLDPAKFDGKIEPLDSTITLKGRVCYQIEIAPNQGTPALLAIDTSDYLVKRVRLNTDMAVVFSYPDDYRLVDGVMMPFLSTEATDAGIVSAVNHVQSVLFNVEVADSLFEPRAKDAKPHSNEASVVVPFELYRNHIYFTVTIPDQDSLRFIFDSGAGGVGLNKDLVEKLKLKKLGDVEARGVGGADVSEVFQLDSLKIMDLTVTDVPVYAMDLAPLQAAGTQRIDGIIGYELLSRYPITVDYENHNLIIHRDGGVSRSNWGEECRLSLDFRLPYIDARVNESVIGRFRLDTGSGSTIDFNSPFVTRNNLIVGDTSAYHPVMAVGIGGGSSGLIGEIASFELCEYRLDSVLVNFSTAGTGIFAGEQTAGNIGAGVLKRFVLTFDYPSEAVYFRPVAQFDQLNRIRNMAGFEIKQVGESLTVASVLSGRGAEALLKSGDRLVSIDGKSTVGMTVARANQLLVGARNSRVYVETEREGKIINVELILDSLY